MAENTNKIIRYPGAFEQKTENLIFMGDHVNRESVR